MRLIDAYARLKELNTPIFQTNDVAAYFNITIPHASKILSRLVSTKQLIYLARGRWAMNDIDDLILPAALTAPFPTYISLQTALYYHGLISQIPSIIYAVSLARTRLYNTPRATVSIHHIQPDFFFGYEDHLDSWLKIATPEKALVDILYLSSTKTGFFHTLPEVEFSKAFKHHEAKKIIAKIPTKKKRDLVEKRYKALVEKINQTSKE